MVKWLNHVTIAAPRNGTNSHTVNPASGTVVAGSAFTPTAGRLLVVLAEGAVTSTTPSGWTLPAGGSAVNNTGLYLWYRTAAGGDTFSTTHNGSNYPVVFDIYEFAAGSAFIGSAAQGNVSASGGAGPSLSGLTAAADFRAAVVGQDITGATPSSFTWSNGAEAVDTGVPLAVTDGYGYSLSYLEDQVGATYSSAATSTITSMSCERLVFAINAVDPPPPGTAYAISGTSASASASSLTPTLNATVTSGPSESSSSGSAEIAATRPIAGTSESISDSSLAIAARKPMSGETATLSDSSLDIAARIPVSGESASTSTSTIETSAALGVSGTSAATSGSGGVIALALPVSGQSDSVSGGFLRFQPPPSDVTPDPGRMTTVASESRVYSVAAENRIVSVEKEDRIHGVDPA